MTSPSLAPAIPRSDKLPGARELFEADGPSSLGSFLQSRGWALDEARPVQALYRPGRSCLVRFRARATGPAGPRILTLCAETSTERQRVVTPPAEFAARFGLFDPVDEVGPYLVWAYPYDPSLRELPVAAWGPSVRELRGKAAAVSVQPLRYRPRRRGVFRYRSVQGREWRTYFGKVIPSGKAARMLSASARLQRAGMPVHVPVQLGRQMLVMPEVAGRSLRQLLVEGGSLPSPARLAGLVGRLAATSPRDISWTRPAPMNVAAGTFELILTLLPHLAREVGRVQDAVEAGHRTSPLARLVHGDLYEAQVFVGSRYSLGLIDLDDVALGDPAMDAANFCAHLLVLALAIPLASRRLVAYRQLALDAFKGLLGLSARDMSWREALCVLQLATGPFRVLDPKWPQEVERRVRLAVRLVEEH